MELLIRWLAAPCVAFLASCGVFMAGAQLWLLAAAVIPSLGDVGPYVLFVLVGFAGVFSGALCLQRRSRLPAAVVLLTAGLVFDWQFWSRINLSSPWPTPGQWPPHFWLLAVGGLGAIMFFLLRRTLDAKTDHKAAA